jgi:hypothetical protein
MAQPVQLVIRMMNLGGVDSDVPNSLETATDSNLNGVPVDDEHNYRFILDILRRLRGGGGRAKTHNRYDPCSR